MECCGNAKNYQRDRRNRNLQELFTLPYREILYSDFVLYPISIKERLYKPGNPSIILFYNLIQYFSKLAILLTAIDWSGRRKTLSLRAAGQVR